LNNERTTVQKLSIFSYPPFEQWEEGKQPQKGGTVGLNIVELGRNDGLPKLIAL
jgi:hypothetical protein